jgi:hypothetical protein
MDKPPQSHKLRRVRPKSFNQVVSQSRAVIIRLYGVVETHIAGNV